MKWTIFILSVITLLQKQVNGQGRLRSTFGAGERANVAGGTNRNGQVPNTLKPRIIPQSMQEVYSWSQMDFNFPSVEARENAIRNGTFVPVNVSVPASVEAAGSRVFVTIPRWLNGVPATLSTVPYPSDTKSPLLTPYPSWEFNRQGNCDGLTSVYRVKVDQCNRLWVLDTGVINAFETPENLCPYQVYVFDLSNDQLLHKFVFPTTVVRSDSLLVTIEVEYPGGLCDLNSSFLYVADSDTFALLVVDISTGNSWRIRDKTMYPSPEAGTFNIVGESFELMDGVFGLALGPYLEPQKQFSDRFLFYNAMNSFNQHWVQTSTLRNQSSALNTPTAYQTVPGTRISQAGDTAMDSQAVLYFGLLGEQALACWNTRVPYSSENIEVLARDDVALQFPVSVQVDGSDRLWMMSTRFQSFAVGTLPANDTNFRVFMAPTAELLRGTMCQTKPGMAGGPMASSLPPTHRPSTPAQRPPVTQPTPPSIVTRPDQTTTKYGFPIGFKPTRRPVTQATKRESLIYQLLPTPSADRNQQLQYLGNYQTRPDVTDQGSGGKSKTIKIAKKVQKWIG